MDHSFTHTHTHACTQASSLYNEGMQPVMYSEVDAKLHNLGWHRAGHNITYFKTSLRRAGTKSEAYYYGLTWSYTFQHAEDTCYFAHCYPYTYTDLQDYLHALLSDPQKALFCKHRTLCHTIAGNPVPILTITSPIVSPQENKRAVVVTARVHPGETNSSWMMKGLLDFLTGPSLDAQIMRDLFIFKVVPMLNPDGVIVGNYRCSLAGRDLNRNYRTKLRDSYPTVWHTKCMVRRLVEEREVVVYCDFHGHSRKQNVFIYGCDTMADPATRLQTRVFPRMLSKNAPTKFSYKGSKFNVHKSKEGTGRVVMWREMGVRNSYTMEATFCGSLLGGEKGLQFSTRDLEAMGYHFCDTLLDYCDPDQSKVEHILHELEKEYRQSVVAKLAALGREVPPGVDPLDIAMESDLESTDAGSNSSESDGPPVHLIGKERKKRRKKLKSRRERNRHKALLKMTHHKRQSTPPHTQQPPPPPDDDTRDMVDAVHRPPSLGAMPYRYSPLEVARNGGIPTFVQERIEERQKKKSDVESSERLSDEVDYVEAMVTEYLKQELPHGTVSEAISQDPRNSLTTLPRPPGPMNIAPMPLYEGRRGQSRTSTRTSLPQLEGPTMLLNTTSSQQFTGSTLHHASTLHHGRAAFTSQYVAHHLGNIIASPSGMQPPATGVQASSGTKNLENLSRLFRQLRPHILHTMTKETKVTHQNSPPRPDLKRQMQPETSREMREKPAGGDNGIVCGGSCKVAEEGGVERVRPLEVKCSQEQYLAVRGRKDEDVHMTNHTPDHKTSANLDKLSRLTNHDRKSFGDIRTSYSSLSSSQATSSWESFSKPAKLSERGKEERGREEKGREEKGREEKGREERGKEEKERERRGKEEKGREERGKEERGKEDRGKEERGREERGQVVPEDKRPPTASIDMMFPVSALRSVPSHYDTLLKNLAERRSAQNARVPGPIPKSASAPDPSTFILHHHSLRDSPPNLPAPTPPGGGGGGVHAHKGLIVGAVGGVQESGSEGKLLKEPGGGKFSTAVPQVTTIVRSSKSDSSALSLPLPLPSLHPLPPADYQEDATNLTLPTTGTHRERYTPVTPNRVLSSKRPSQYGRKPTADNGTLPSTVSLKLSGRVNQRPATMHSQHRPKPLHVRYFTKKATNSNFFS